jgi:hypothetical protein
LDGKDSGVRTDGVVDLPASGRVLLTLRKDGFRDGARTLSLPLASGEDVSMDLLPLEVMPAVISDPVLLGSVTIASAYPLEVSWRGRVLSQAQASPRVSLPAGRQSLSLLSPGVFLRSTVTVDVKEGGDSAVEAPGLGKLSIKANPDNCQVFIDGTFVDYPPILDKPLVAGTHTVSFRWADGGRSEETVAVARGGIAFVTGRRD